MQQKTTFNFRMPNGEVPDNEMNRIHDTSAREDINRLNTARQV